LYFYLFEDRDLRQRQTNRTLLFDTLLDTDNLYIVTIDLIIALNTFATTEIVNTNVDETSDETITITEHRLTSRNS
jgi:hypothetical protein